MNSKLERIDWGLVATRRFWPGYFDECRDFLEKCLSKNTLERGGNLKDVCYNEYIHSLGE